MGSQETFSAKSQMAVSGIMTLLLGVVIFGCGLLAQSRVRQTAQWPSVSGRVVNSEVQTSATRSGRVTVIKPVARVVYDYSVNGVRYECDRRRVVPMFHTANGTPEEIVARHPVGTRVNVYYDPANPQDALLSPIPEKGAVKLMGALFYVALPVALLGLGLLVVGGSALVVGGSKLIATARAATPDTQTALRALKQYSLGNQPPAKPATRTPPQHPTRPATRTRPPHPTRPLKLHWSVRVAAAVLGLLMFPVGLLLFAVCASMPSDEHGMAIHLTTLTIFGFIALLGAVLLWVGFKKHRGAENVMPDGQSCAAS